MEISTGILHLRGAIIKNAAEQKELAKSAKMLIQQLRNACKHEVVIETPYQGGEMMTLPPRRLCVVCGLEEDGWGSGYKALRNVPIKVIDDRDEFYRYRELQPLETIVVPKGMFTSGCGTAKEQGGA